MSFFFYTYSNIFYIVSKLNDSESRLNLGVWWGQTWMWLQTRQDGSWGKELQLKSLCWHALKSHTLMILSRTCGKWNFVKMFDSCSCWHSWHSWYSWHSCWYFLEPVQSEMFDSFSCQMKKLETKMATMNEDKDKRIGELQARLYFLKAQFVIKVFNSWAINYYYYFRPTTTTSLTSWRSLRTATTTSWMCQGHYY